MEQLMHLLQMTDSSFPIGSFSFSMGLESAVNADIIDNTTKLKQFVETMMRQNATSDAVVALAAYRATKQDNYELIINADNMSFISKMNEETRIMQQRMGKKLVELACKLTSSDIIAKYLTDIEKGNTPGTYPTAHGISSAIFGLSEHQLFAAQQYGTANMILSAALRCCKVSHFETQRIMFEVSQTIDTLYSESNLMQLDDIYSFMPQSEIFASMHEKGKIRMFMN